jgi:hypothetical protein
LKARRNSKKNAAIEALVVPTDEMRNAGNGGARTLILSIRFMRKAEVNEGMTSHVFLDECLFSSRLDFSRIGREAVDYAV